MQKNNRKIRKEKYASCGGIVFGAKYNPVLKDVYLVYSEEEFDLSYNTKVFFFFNKEVTKKVMREVIYAVFDKKKDAENYIKQMSE